MRRINFRNSDEFLTRILKYLQGSTRIPLFKRQRLPSFNILSFYVVTAFEERRSAVKVQMKMQIKLIGFQCTFVHGKDLMKELLSIKFSINLNSGKCVTTAQQIQIFKVPNRDIT